MIQPIDFQKPNKCIQLTEGLSRNFDILSPVASDKKS